MTIKIIVWVLLVLCTCFIIFGLFYRPPVSQFFIDSGRKHNGVVCMQTPTTCNSDQDCSACIDNMEVVCTEITRNPDQEKLYGKSGKYCLPKIPDQPCNLQNGGIWTWTGWASTDRMEWDCLCTYPQIAGGPGCSELNPNVCAGGNWSYDASIAMMPPSYKDCVCPQDHQLVSTLPSNVPMCIPKGDWSCKTPEMCKAIYSNTEIKTNDTSTVLKYGDAVYVYFQTINTGIGKFFSMFNSNGKITGSTTGKTAFTVLNANDPTSLGQTVTSGDTVLFRSTTDTTQYLTVPNIDSSNKALTIGPLNNATFVLYKYGGGDITYPQHPVTSDGMFTINSTYTKGSLGQGLLYVYTDNGAIYVSANSTGIRDIFPMQLNCYVDYT